MTTRIAGLFGIKRHLALAEELRAQGPRAVNPPISFDATRGITNWGMEGNDVYGNCFWAALYHALWAQTGVQPTGDPVAWYQTYLASQGEPTSAPGDGTDPSSGSQSILNQGLAQAVGVIQGPVSPALTHQAIVDFHGGVIVCLALDPDAQQEFAAHLPWGAESANPDVMDGHAVTGVAYTLSGDVFVTWGALQSSTIRFDDNCIDGLVLILAHGGDSALIAKWGLVEASTQEFNGNLASPDSTQDGPDSPSSSDNSAQVGQGTGHATGPPSGPSAGSGGSNSLGYRGPA
jgi:hypothetical protein